MRKIKIFLIWIVVLIFLTACKQLLKDLDEDFSYWTANVYIKNADTSGLPLDNDKYASIPYGNDYKIKLHIFNDKNHTIRNAVDSNSNKDIVVFEKGVTGSDGTTPPKTGVDYTLKQINQNTLELNLSKAFLERSENGIKNLSPTITLYNNEGLKFSKPYTFKLRANTPPPFLEYKAAGKTKTADTSGKHYYVLCFAVNDMDKTVSTGLLHKDIAAISFTTHGGETKNIPLTADGSGFNISKSGGLLLPDDKVEKLAPADMTTGLTPDNIPTGKWNLYFKTDVEVKGAEKTYSFKLIDQKGLSSSEVKVSTTANKSAAVSLYHNNTPITAENEANAYLISCGGSTGAITLQARAKAGTAITGTIEKKLLGSNSWTVSSTVSGTTNADFNLPALGNSENEALYKITLKANTAGYSESESKTFFVKLTKAFVVSFRVAGGNGNLKGEYSGTEQTASGTDTKIFTVLPNSNVTFTATPDNGWEIDSWNVNGSSVNGTNTAYQLYSITATQTVTVTFKKSGLPVLKLVQNFNDTNNSHKNISAGAKGYVTEDIIPDAAQYTENNPLVIYNTNSAAKFSLGVPSGAEAHYSLERLGSGGNILTADSTGNEISLQSASKFKIKVWAVKDGVTGTETELYVQVKTGLNTYKELKNTVQNAPVFGNGININIDTTELTCTDENSEIEVRDGKKLIIQTSSTGTVRTINADKKGRIFKISGTGTELTLRDIKLEKGKAADGKGGAVYVEDGTLKLADSTVIPPSAAPDENKAGENDIYLVSHKKIIIAVPLTPQGGKAGRITPQNYTVGIPLLEAASGINLTNETGKFTVTPEPLSDGNTQKWTIDNQGKLEIKGIVINGSDANAWKALKDAVAAAPNGGTITIEGEIMATNDAGNNGEILIDKNLTIKGADKSNDKLNANQLSRIFKITAGRLTLEKLTLIGGKTAGPGEPNGGAIFMSGANITSTITDCDIGGDNEQNNNNASQKGGGIYLNIANGSLTVKDSRIRYCTAQGSPEGIGGGGGVYLENGDLIFEGVVMYGNTASIAKGRGVWVKGGSFKIKDIDAAPINLDPTNSGGKAPDDVYLANGKFIEVTGELKGSNVACITPESYAAGKELVKGSGFSIPKNYKDKFAVTKDPQGRNWKLEHHNPNSLALKQAAEVINNWTELKNKIEDINGPAEIEIEGEIQAGSPDSAIDVSRSITVKKKDSAAKAVLKANTSRLFNVTNGSLTLLNLELSGAQIISGNGGGIEVHGGKLVLHNTDMENFKTTKNGGAVYVTGNGILEIKGTSKITNCEAKGNASGGGALYLNGAGCKVTMETGTEISGCKANTTSSTKQNKGGAVYIEKGTFELKGGKINKNESEADGGGIYMSGGIFNMSTGEINGNEALNDGSGGGIYMGGGTFNMTGGTIGGTTEQEGNKAEANEGGGVCLVGNGCTFNMSGGTIQSNTSKDGAGVYILAGTFDMTDGTILKNKKESDGKGSGIHLADNSAVLKMSGSAKVSIDDTPKNDIYLAANTTITVESLPSSLDACITPANYQENTRILKGESGNAFFIEAVKKFRLSKDKTNPVNIWAFKPDGTITKFDKNISFNEIKDTFGSFINQKSTPAIHTPCILYEFEGTYGIMECIVSDSPLKFNYRTDGINSGNWINDAQVSLGSIWYLNRTKGEQSNPSNPIMDRGFKYEKPFGLYYLKAIPKENVKFYAIPEMIDID